MKRTFDIAWKDIMEILRDRMSFLFLLIMPIAFTLLFGYTFGSPKPTNTDPRLPVGYLDLDQSQISQELKGLLMASDVIRLDEESGKSFAAFEKLVGDNKLAAAIIVPSDYGSSIRNDKPIKLNIILDPSSSAGRTIQESIVSAVLKLGSTAKMAQVITQNTGGDFHSTMALALSKWEEPPVNLQVTSGSAPSGKENQSGALMSISHLAPGMMLQFGLAGLLTAAQVLVKERKSRCLQRLLTTSVARHQILLGHYLAIFMIIFCQFIILITFGQVILKLDYMRQPLAILIMALMSALFIAGLGLLTGTLAKSDEQVIIFAMIFMFAFAGLGGAWVPLEATSKTFQVIGHLTPLAWAMDGFKNIIVRGLDLSSIWVPAAALLGYALLFFGLAVWKFKFE